MEKYHNYAGIDIGKYNFVATFYGQKDSMEYENTPEGRALFIKDNKKKLLEGLSIVETTGGQELALLFAFSEEGIPVHRANARRVKSFIASIGGGAKSDKLDAKALALYGFERGDRLPLFIPLSESAYELFELSQRRGDLKQMLVAEKNRLKAPRTLHAKESVQSLISILTIQIDSITVRINEIINDDENLRIRKEILMTVNGIGEIVSNELISKLPELGSLTRQEIASLVGVAPRSNDSGIYSGYRSTGYGREGIKSMLFVAAMAARRSNSYFKEYYESLIKRGKKKMVAMVALMRKIIVVANARVRDLLRNTELSSAA